MYQSPPPPPSAPPPPGQPIAPAAQAVCPTHHSATWHDPPPLTLYLPPPTEPEHLINMFKWSPSSQPGPFTYLSPLACQPQFNILPNSLLEGDSILVCRHVILDCTNSISWEKPTCLFFCVCIGGGWGTCVSGTPAWRMEPPPLILHNWSDQENIFYPRTHVITSVVNSVNSAAHRHRHTHTYTHTPTHTHTHPHPQLANDLRCLIKVDKLDSTYWSSTDLSVLFSEMDLPQHTAAHPHLYKWTCPSIPLLTLIYINGPAPAYRCSPSSI